MPSPSIFMNGRIMPAEQAAISPLDIGLLRGYAVFDLLRTVGGRPFLLAEHLKRLRASAELLGLTVPYSDAEIAEAIDELLLLNGHRRPPCGSCSPAAPRQTACTSIPRRRRSSSSRTSSCSPPASLYDTGGKLLTKQHLREVPEAKTTNYLTMLRHRNEIEAQGAMDLLYHDGTYIAEAASASFYVVRDGVIRAPHSDVLWGTVGALVLELAAENHEVLLGAVTLEEAFAADEAFLTSTTRGVLPIVQLDGRPSATARWGRSRAS